jgi:hypothetical protein
MLKPHLKAACRFAPEVLGGKMKTMVLGAE